VVVEKQHNEAVEHILDEALPCILYEVEEQ
jgi:hypothetical protein